jgi:hypothetical protein
MAKAAEAAQTKLVAPKTKAGKRLMEKRAAKLVSRQAGRAGPPRSSDRGHACVTHGAAVAAER